VQKKGEVERKNREKNGWRKEQKIRKKKLKGRSVGFGFNEEERSAKKKEKRKKERKKDYFNKRRER